MVALRLGAALVLSLLAFVGSAVAADAPSPGLYDRPVLVIDPGMHTANIKRADADAEGRWAVTGSYDKTVRVWSLADGTLQRTIRLPAGPGNVGKAYAVAISPDGTTIAAGGLTRGVANQEQIYLFDRATGALVRRIEGLPNVVLHLVFSPDGQRLAATLGSGGLRVYARASGWAEIARDAQYGDQSYGAAFARDGRLATTVVDGRVRLYTGALQGDLHPAREVAAPGGQQPFGIAFSPDGTRLAVGYADSTAVDVLDGHSLTARPGPDLRGIDRGDLGNIAWSRDGRTLFAAGGYEHDDSPVLAWSDAGAGARRVLPAGRSTVMSLVPLPEGDLLVAAADPWLGRLGQDGTPRWVHGPPLADFRAIRSSTLSVSADGTRIDFGFAYGGQRPARFDLAARTLHPSPPADGQTAAPRQTGLPIEGWEDTTTTTLAGHALALAPYEMSRSLAVDPSGGRFVLGTEWRLRAFDAKGIELWQRPVPGIVWAVNITGDGRLVVAAYADGTIRWHRMTDGAELLAFFPLPDKINWVAWTPEGFYAATPGARGILRWHVNHGWDHAAESVPIEDIPDSFRPAVLPLVLQELETPRALGLADLVEHNKQVALHTHSEIAPGARLHLLTIGISAYNDDYAKTLRLQFADRDARDLASAIDHSQGSLYAQVKTQVLQNDEADKGGILSALATMRRAMATSTGEDLAVVHFSGHGALVEGTLYLLPYDVDAHDDVGIERTGISIDEFRKQIALLAEHGRVLLLLDACHSGATTADTARLAMDSTALRTALSAPNVTVLTSSSGAGVSREDPAWGHGAFTKALLDALADPAADPDHTGLIGTNALAHYLAVHVPAMTEGAQKPDMEVRFDTTLFAAGM